MHTAQLDFSQARPFHTKPTYIPRDHLRPEREPRRESNVIPFKPAEPDNRHHFDPVPARIADLREACLALRIRPLAAIVGEVILLDTAPDRHGNWRTIRPMTGARIAAKVAEKTGRDCGDRSIKAALAELRKAFPWWNWRRSEGGNVFAMDGVTGVMIGRMVAHSGSFLPDAKESPRRWHPKEEGNGSSYRKDPAPVVRLARWRATLQAEVIAFGISLGLTRREVLAIAERFERWYATHPEREPADLTGAFCGYRWLQRDAKRKAAKRASRPATMPSPFCDGIMAQQIDTDFADDVFADADDGSEDEWRATLLPPPSPPMLHDGRA